MNGGGITDDAANRSIDVKEGKIALCHSPNRSLLFHLRLHPPNDFHFPPHQVFFCAVVAGPRSLQDAQQSRPIKETKNKDERLRAAPLVIRSFQSLPLHIKKKLHTSSIVGDKKKTRRKKRVGLLPL